jgi:uncharacterized membrane protein YphA (DoxX/SURF4 family)
LCRLALGAIFVVAAVAKARDLPGFAQDIANYRLLPAGLVAPAAATLPGVEAVLGLALIARLWPRASALCAAAFLCAFTIAVASALARDINIECGCFGSSGQPATWWTFGRDLGLCALAGVVVWRSPG